MRYNNVLLASLIVLMIWIIPTSATEVTGCMVINSSGDYQLINDISNSDSNICIDILDTPNVVFEGNGHTIQGKYTQGTTAIRIGNGQNVTIKNTKLRDWDTGVRSAGKYTVLEYNDASNLVNGIIVSGQYSNIKNNILNNNAKIGISVDTNDVTILSNTIKGNNQYGLLLNGAYHTVSQNTIQQNAMAGRFLTSDGNTIQDNIITDNHEGVYFTAPRNNIIKNNMIKNNQWGFFLNDASGNIITNNYFSGNQAGNVANDGVWYANIWNTTKTTGSNIHGGSYLGGNYWGDSGGDTNGDGFCEQPHTISDRNIDYYSLCDATTTTTTTTTTITPTPTPALNSTANGSINVKSSPSISKIFLNSVFQDYTPKTLYNITPGTYTVLIRSAGYNDYSESVAVTAGNISYVTASLVLSPEVTTATVTAPTTTVTTVKTTAKSTVKVPTPWPSATATPAPASPVGVLVILGAVGVGFIIIRKW